jgi:hypothetical protein
MIETFKRQDGEGLGANKVGDGSGENIPEPPKTHHKNDFPPKPNHLRNRLDTTAALLVFSPQNKRFPKAYQVSEHFRESVLWEGK